MAMASPGTGRKPDLSASQAQYRRRAPQYDTELAPFEPWRVSAIDKLALGPGESVIDVGCGTGLSFGRLRQAVGPQGRIVAFDPCAEMTAQAGKRIRLHRWTNVELSTAPAHSVRLHGRADAALFHFTHDVLRDEAALRHVLAHLKPGARVVATGLQWAPPWNWPANGFVLMAALYSVSSLEGLERPWDRLAAHLVDLQVDVAALGGIFVASGRLPAAHGPAHAG
jgi:SAM-dependent methyltransferase